MKRYVAGVDPSQNMLFPKQLDDYVRDDNIGRAVDAIILSA